MNIAPILEKDSIELESLAGRVIAIDAYNAIYQFVSAIRQPDGRPLSDTGGRPTSHLMGLLHRNSRLMLAGIRPVYVFDGIPNILKSGTLEKRKEAKIRAEAKYAEAIEKKDMEKAHSYAMQTSRLTEEIITESMRMLDLLGIPYLTAPEDGEAQASVMAARGDVWAIGSQDFDSLLFGAPRCVRNLTLSSRRKMPGSRTYREIGVEMVSLDANLRRLEITREQLVDLAILVGTDFNEGAEGIGPKKALKIVREKGKIENTPYLAEIGEKTVEEVRSIFLRPKFIEEYRLEWKKPQREELIEFLCREHDFSVETVSKVVDSLSAVDIVSQQSLDKWS